MARLPVFIAVFTLSALFNLNAETGRKPTQVEVAASLRGFDVTAAVKKQLILASNDQTVQLPRVTTKAGKIAVIRIAREFPYPIDFDSDNTPIAFDTANLGVVLTIKPYIRNGKITFSGSLLLSTTAEQSDSKRRAGDIPTIRTSKKIFSGKTKSGGRVQLNALTPSGEDIVLSLTLTLMDETGRRVK